APVKLFYSLLRRTIQKHDTANYLQCQAHFINFLRCEKHLKELFEYQSMWKKYPLMNMNVFTNLISPNLKILAYGYKYYMECLNEVDQKRSLCLEFLQNRIKANAKNTQVQESMEELKNETAEDNKPIISRGIEKTELDDLLQKLKGLK
ncbi:30287_t:CDS:2, partial [Gigaspora margarita]